MPVITSYKQGTPCWVELATKDEAGATDFYTKLFGWNEDAVPMGNDQYYHMFALKGSTVAGMFKQGPEMGDHPPYWGTYIAVNNADEAGKKAAEAGGKVAMEPMDVFDAGRMVVVQDSTDAFVSFWQAKDHIGTQIANETGTPIWHELMTKDSSAAADFYRKVLGVGVNKMEDPMSYTMLEVDGRPVAGIMDIQPEMGPMPPHWGVYFAVDDTDAYAKKAESLGATVLVPPQDIPGVGRFSVLQDPQGAVFNIVKVDTPPQ